MVDYFKNACDRYFGDEKPAQKKDSILPKFKVSKKYKQRDMEIEIVEYEIKD